MNQINKFNSLKHLYFYTGQVFCRTIALVMFVTCFMPDGLSQNCATNAGLDQVICVNQSLNLSGAVYQPQSSPPFVRWRQISGPNTAVISSPSAITTPVTGIIPGLYIFELINACTVDTARDRVAINVLQQTPTVLVGKDTQVCGLSAVNLSGTIPGAGVTGTWTVTPTNGTFSNINSATSTFTPTHNSTVYTLRWTLSNGACSTSNTMAVKAVGAVTPVSAGADFTVTCNGPSTVLNGSNPGLMPPQSALWTFISGPSTPIFNNRNIRNPTVNGLIVGTYEFKYEVSGPCASGNDNVLVTVGNVNVPPNPGTNQTYTNYCTVSSSTTEVLTGLPLQTGETAKWVQVSGTGVTFSPNDYESQVTVGNLVAPSKSWYFTYTKTSSNGCVRFTNHNVHRVDSFTGFTVPSTISPACNANAVFDVSWTGLSATVSEGLTRTVTFVSGPLVPTGTPSRSGLTTYSDRWTISNLTLPGTYVYLVSYSNRCGSRSAYITINNSRTPGTVNAGSNIIVPCAQTFTFPTGFSAAPGALSWVQVSGPNTATLANTNSAVLSMSNLASGRYVMRLSNSGGANCSTRSDTMEVIVPQQPTTTVNLGPDDTVCAGSYRLTGTQPTFGESGTWTVSPSAGITFSPNNRNPRAYAVGLDTNKVYTFTWTITGACGSKSDQQIITTLKSTAPAIPNAGTDQCLGSASTTATLNGNSKGTSTSLWTALTPGSSIVSPSAQSTTANISGGTGVYHFVYTFTATGCDAFSDTVSISINHNITSVNAGADKSFCGISLPASSSVTANVAAPAGAVSTWYQTSGPAAASIATPGSISSNITQLRIGIYEFTYAISVGSCNGVRDTTQIVIADPPTVANAGPDQSICGTGAGGTAIATLAANTPASGAGIWSMASGPGSITFSSPSAPAAVVSGLIYGTYTLVWNITPAGGAGICQTSSDTMIITVVPSAFAGDDQAVCQVSNIQLTGNAKTAGTWTLVSGSPAPTLTSNSPNSSTASGLGHSATGNGYVFRYTLPVIGSCPSTSDEITITNYSQPSQADAGSDVEICHNQSSVTLNAVVPTIGNGYWTYVSGPGTPATGSANNTSNDTNLLNLSAGVHTFRFNVVTHPTACLVSTDDVLVIRERSAFAGNDTAACSPDSLFLNASSAVFNNMNWSVLSGPGTPVFSNATNPLTRIKNLSPGVYDLRFSITNPVGCPTNTDDVRLTIDEKIVGLQAGRDTLIWVNNSVSLGNSTAITGVSYQWSPATFLNSTNISNPLFTVGYSPGTYIYTVTGTRGVCVANDQVTVSVQGSKISGTVRNDAEGNRDNDVDGPGFSNATVNMYLLQNDYIVKKTTASSVNGTYDFLDINTQVEYVIFATPLNYNIGDKITYNFFLQYGPTGEDYGINNLSGTGLDSAVGDAFVKVKSGNAFVTEVDFGMNWLPVANQARLNNVLNRGGTYKHDAPILTGNDVEDGPQNGNSPFNDTLIFLSKPQYGTVYYDNIPVDSGTVIPNFDNSKLKVDPHFDGDKGYVLFWWGWKDQSGMHNSMFWGLAVMTFKYMYASFRLYSDGDALHDGQIDGNAIGSLRGQKIYSYLIDENTGLVIDTLHVRRAPFITKFESINAYYPYSIRLSTISMPKDGPPPTEFGVPNGWQLIGEQYGTANNAGTGIESGSPDGKILVNTLDTWVNNIRFGVNYKTLAHRKRYAIDPNSVTGLTGRPRWSFTHWLPLYNSSGNTDTSVVQYGTGMLPGRLSGYDLEDGRIRGLTGRATAKVALRNLPDTGNALLQYESGGTVYHFPPVPAASDPSYIFWDPVNNHYVIPDFNPDNLKMLLKMAYQDSTSFQYAYVDSTNTLGSFTPYTLGYITPLPIEFSMGGCLPKDNGVMLSWTTFNELNYHAFSVMRKLPGNSDYQKIGEVKAKGYGQVTRNYQFFDAMSEPGTVYRIDVHKSTDEIWPAGLCAPQLSKPLSLSSGFTVFPNPVQSILNIIIENEEDTEPSWRLVNSIGQDLFINDKLFRSGATTYSLDMSGFPAGLYTLRYLTENSSGIVKIVKQDIAH